MDYGDYYWVLYGSYYGDPFPHSLLSTGEVATLVVEFWPTDKRSGMRDSRKRVFIRDVNIGASILGVPYYSYTRMGNRTLF